jgi:Tfp pilus assembly protein PilX
MRYTRNITLIKKNQDGFASIVIALILIIVLALLTVGFSQVARSEQQNALSKQLANQAYYAAETGINDAVTDYQDKAITISNTTNINTNNCIVPPAAGTPAALTSQNVIDSQTGVAYTCIIMSLDPSSLQFSPVNKEAGVFTTFQAVDGVGAPSSPTNSILKDITVTWTSQDAVAGSCNSTSPISTSAIGYLKPSGWNCPAVIQFSITPEDSSTNSAFERQNLIGNTFTDYMYPDCTSSANATVPYAPSNSSAGYNVQGIITSSTYAGSSCGNSRSVTISGLPVPATPDDYYYTIHLLNYYDASNISITGTLSNGDPAWFSGSQILIDSTGQAKDVLKRLQVRVPINSTSTVNYAVEGQNICKREQTMPGSSSSQLYDPINNTYSSSSGTQYIPVGGGALNPTDSCNLDN